MTRVRGSSTGGTNVAEAGERADFTTNRHDKRSPAIRYSPAGKSFACERGHERGRRGHRTFAVSGNVPGLAAGLKSELPFDPERPAAGGRVAQSEVSGESGYPGNLMEVKRYVIRGGLGSAACRTAPSSALETIAA